ncbi:unnamed protein product [Haemonchus placei]|uniref:C3H1-type domain-containing protein n=1 Tax=Haemonchus placei TaxID=6290 RepID=A0A0N4W139_HAEPC|nr:unnamed protein product [Haemonchus placei]
MLLKIPVFVVIYFTTYTLASYDYPTQPPYGDCYQCWLYRQCTVGRQHCHRQHPVVIEAPRHVIYTTPASTGVVYTGTTVYQTPAYPAAQPSVYLQAQYPTAQATAPAVTTPQAPPEYKP